MRVAIVGAGISGLAAACYLDRSGRCQVTVYEAGPTVGGKIQTLQEAGFTIEQAPESVFSTKPWAVELIEEIGLGDELIEPIGSGFSILLGDELHTVPRPLAAMMPSTPGALEAAGFLSPAAKARVLEEATIPPGSGADESVASFFRRRFGDEFSMKIVEPLLAGTHAGDASRLSMAALYPKYLAMEQQFGSIAAGAGARSEGPQHRGTFLSLKGGMASLPKALVSKFKSVDLRLSTPVFGVTPTGVAAADGVGSFDHVILATPAYISADFLREAAPEAAKLLSEIRFVSTAVVTLGFEPDSFDVTPSGNGYLVPSGEHSNVTGSTWTSLKWANRAPGDMYLLRSFFGRNRFEGVLSNSDDDLISLALEELDRLFAVEKSPILSRVDRWAKGMPQYEMGHVERLRQIESELSGLPISLIGCSYRGNGIPDCVRSGREVAAAILDF